MTPLSCDRQQGFSLLELSVVLTIIGLLAGGIVVGQDMLQQTELRGVMVDLRRYVTAVNAFRLQYRGLPGDLRNATQLWGAAHADPTTCAATASTGTETCNGNGNGSITYYGATAETHERFRFWQHLSNAKLIEGSFTGVAGGGGTQPTFQPLLGVNVPRSSIQNSGFYVENNAVIPSGNANFFPGKYENYIQFGAALDFGMLGPSLKPADAMQIDQKMDDGLPHRGIIAASPNTRPATPNCVTGSSGGNAYNATYNFVGCNLYLLLGGPL